jgi:hypothetical protein
MTTKTNTYKLLQEKFPFLTIIRHMSNDYLGIVQNADNLFVSIYILDMTFSDDMKRAFLACGDAWWWESNRCIPINMFLREQFKPFKHTLKTFARKDTEIVQGPTVNLKDMMNKRVKRRTIQLVRSV